MGMASTMYLSITSWARLSSSSRLARRVARSVRTLRGLELYKPPGVAEAINWAAALHVLGVEALDEPAIRHTMSAVLKYEEDQQAAEGALAEVAGDG